MSMERHRGAKTLFFSVRTLWQTFTFLKLYEYIAMHIGILHTTFTFPEMECEFVKLCKSLNLSIVNTDCPIGTLC